MRSNGEGTLSLAGCYLVILIANCILGAWSVNYLLLMFFNKTIPFIGAFVIGLFTGEITIPVAIVFSILKYFS